MPNSPLMDPGAQDVSTMIRELWTYTATGGLQASSTGLSHPLYEVVDQPKQARAGLGYNANFNASAILERNQEYQIQVIATTFASCSILAAICAIFWFCMMRRNFRRDLVLLLICGDFWKSLWFLVFSVLSLSIGRDVPTTSPFCQVSGYFLQVGLETCDIAILLMSLHMQLQIFPLAQSFLGHDGLYRVRKYALAFWFIVPNVDAALAFVNNHDAFVSQGGFCTLPIRPFWYRLALSWIPRYLIWIYIMYVAVRIYTHVGYEFKVFGQERDGSSSLSGSTAADTRPSEILVPMQRSRSVQSDAGTVEKQPLPDEVAPDNDTVPPASAGRVLQHDPLTTKGQDSARRQSLPNWSMPFGGKGLEHMERFDGFGGDIPRSKSNPSSRRGSRQIAAGVGAEDFASTPNLPPPVTLDRHRGSVSTMASMRSSGAHSNYDQPLDTIAEGRTSMTSATSHPSNEASKVMKKRRKAIQRQLRLLFIYPVVYMALWVLPFVNHALNYSNHYAQHPIFALNALNIFCQTIMGLCDVTIFCWREKPWRHIPGSDGTFVGSFFFWRYAFSSGFSEARRKSSAPLEAMTRDESRSGLLHNLKRWSMSFSSRIPSPKPSRASIPALTDAPAPTTPSKRPVPPPMHRRTHSGGSDRRILQAEQAARRLQLERADYHANRRSLQDVKTSVISAQLSTFPEQQQQATPTRKEWWDRHLSISDGVNDD